MAPVSHVDNIRQKNVLTHDHEQMSKAFFWLVQIIADYTILFKNNISI